MIFHCHVSLPEGNIFGSLHPGKLTCPLKKGDYFNRKYIFQSLIFRGHVSFLDLFLYFFTRFGPSRFGSEYSLDIFYTPAKCFRWGAATRVSWPGEFGPIKRQGFSPPENSTAGTWKMMGFLQVPNRFSWTPRGPHYFLVKTMFGP